MTLDDKIHTVLDKLNGTTEETDLFDEIPNWVEVDNLEKHQIVRALLKEKLIVNHGTTYVITRYGKALNSVGGWKHFVEMESYHESNRLERERYELLNSKWLYRTKWLPHGLSVFAIIVAGFSLAVSVRQCQQGQRVQNKTEQESPTVRVHPTIQPTADSSRIDSLSN